MAVTVTITEQGADFVVADVEATADADVAAAITHGLGTAPIIIHLEPLQVEFYTSAPNIGVVNATTLNLVMANAVGSGVAGDQIRVIAHINPKSTR